MKLNYRRTILVGFAFFLICTFWQAYDTIIPKILTDRFGLPQAWSGIIMALDNILALFLLPLFGSLSDKSRSKKGRRTPFIFVGTIVAVAAFLFLTVADAAQLKNLGDVARIDDPAALGIVYDRVGNETLTTPEGQTFVLSDRWSKNSFTSIRSEMQETKISADYLTYTPVGGTPQTVISRYKTHIVTYDGSSFFIRERETLIDTPIEDSIVINNRTLSLSYIFRDGLSYEDLGVRAFTPVTNAVYTNFVVPARQAYIHTLTLQNPAPLIWFMAILLIVLLAMSSFRSPAVALMPDVTPKPLRSKANAVINLMGTLGGMLVLILGTGMFFANSATENTFRPYFGFFAAVGGIMLAALVVFLLTVKEPKWAEEAEKENELLQPEPDAPQEPAVRHKLSRAEKLSLMFLLASVALWFFGYNAVTSKYSVYATNVLDLDYSTTLLVANAAAVIAYLPVGIIATKVGRKKTILAGIVLLTVAFGCACFLRVGSSPLLMNVLFALAGIGWATINVNSFPMVVELAQGGEVGRYTGYYYAASMAAQALTPFLSGLLMDRFGMTVLFPYAAVFVALAFGTMLLVKHGDSKPVPKKDLLEHYNIEDD